MHMKCAFFECLGLFFSVVFIFLKISCDGTKLILTPGYNPCKCSIGILNCKIIKVIHWKKSNTFVFWSGQSNLLAFHFVCKNNFTQLSEPFLLWLPIRFPPSKALAGKNALGGGKWKALGKLNSSLQQKLNNSLQPPFMLLAVCWFSVGLPGVQLDSHIQSL